MHLASYCKHLAAFTAATAMVASGLLVMPATPAVADILSTPAPVRQRPASSVTADDLPTVQIDTGVVWTQAIVGNTVYAGGQFTNTRPAGAAKGQNLTPRSNLLAYDIRTGDLIKSFDHPVNGPVKVVRASADGKRLYIGGTFTQVDGKPRYNVAAFDTTTGALIENFRPLVSGGYVNAIAATSTTVYLGGTIGSVNGIGRNNLAAVSPSGATLAWNPTADGQVDTMVIADKGEKLIVGGRFGRVNNAVSKGMAALSPSTGATMSWPVNAYVSNGGSSHCGVWDLSTDGTYVFGTAWAASTGCANLEGSFSADAKTGELNTLNYVLGDNYGIYSDGTTQYQTSHTHDASIIGGFGNYSSAMPNGGPHQYSLAYTVEPQGRTNSTGYWNRPGIPAPAIVNWYPRWYSGSFTGMGQAGWTITGDGRYVVVGGEFPAVNSTNQYGLTRFARTDLAPNKSGPRENGTTWGTPRFSPSAEGEQIQIRANWDRDDRDLTYNLLRSGTAKPVASTTIGSDSWNRANVVLTDRSAVPGQTYTYQVQAVDPAGNSMKSAPLQVVAQGSEYPCANLDAKVTRSTVVFDASGSTGGRGRTISSYAWDFGDGKTGTGATATHKYATNGTYNVKLTVTNNAGKTASVTTQVKVDPTIASDNFNRTSSSGWGTASVGGAWSTAAGLEISSSQGVANITNKGQTRQAYLSASSAEDADAVVDVKLSSQPAGGSTMVALVLRHNGTNDYRAKAVVGTDKKVSFYLTKNVAGVETALKAIVLTPTYTAGQVMRVRFQAVSSGSKTTALKAKAWLANTAEPASWQLSATDTQSVLQNAGQVGLWTYLSSAGTNLPQKVSFDNLRVVEP